MFQKYQRIFGYQTICYKVDNRIVNVPETYLPYLNNFPRVWLEILKYFLAWTMITFKQMMISPSIFNLPTITILFMKWYFLLNCKFNLNLLHANDPFMIFIILFMFCQNYFIQEKIHVFVYFYLNLCFYLIWHVSIYFLHKKLLLSEWMKSFKQIVEGKTQWEKLV